MTTYNTGNPIGSAEVKDLYDNAENLDIAINSPSADVWTDRLGQARKTWRGIQSEAQLEIAQVVGEVTAQSQQYLDASIVARDEARAAASASGPIAFYGTYAAAQAAVGGLPDGGIVEVSQDETRAGARTRYKVQAGALVFAVNLDQLRIDLATSAGASMIGYQPAGAGAVAEDMQSKLRETVSIRDFGVKGDGTDETALINAANAWATAAGKALFWPAGTYVSSGIPTITNMKWVGENSSTTIIKLKNGTNAGLVTHTSAAGADYIWISGFTFDGNSANNTTGTVLTITGIRPTLKDLFVINAAKRGIQTNWILQGIGYGDLTGAQGYFERITIAESQEEGWVHLAPTDSYFNCIDFLNCGLKATNTYAAFDIQSNGRFSNIHPSNGGDRTIVPGVGVKVSSNGNNFTNCHFEGGYTPLLVQGNCNVFENCTYYAPRGPYCVDLAGVGNRLTGTTGATYYSGNYNYKGVLLRGANNMVEVADTGCVNGVIDFTGSQGGNIVRVAGYHDSGVTHVGTPNAKDDVLITVGGPGGGVLVQSSPVPWTTYTPVVTSAGGALSSYSATARYRRDGNTVQITVIITITNNGTGSGAVAFNLPIAAQRGLLFGREDALTGKSLQARFAPSATQAVIADYANAYPGGTGSVLVLSGSYEVFM